MEKGGMDNIDLFSIIFSGSIHDFEHPGYNNTYLINVGHKFALRYNDQSVLENHHVAATYALMNEKKYNIVSSFSKEGKLEFRKRVVSMVLSTDISKHFIDLGKFKQRIANDSFDAKDEDKLLCMGMGMHMADISNPSKKWSVSFNWIELLFEEFFAQGDVERKKGMNITDLMDRT